MPADPVAAVLNEFLDWAKADEQRAPGADGAVAETLLRLMFDHLGIAAFPSMRVEHPVWYEKTEVLRAPVTGIWRPAVDRMHSVAKDALIGRIVDPFGNVLREIRAPFSGEMLYVVGTPPVSEGEPVGMIAAQ